MRRRLVLVPAVVLYLAACGGTDEGTAPPGATNPAKTKTQLAAEKLLKQLDGEDCDCTGEARAKARIEDGKATPHQNGYVLAPER